MSTKVPDEIRTGKITFGSETAKVNGSEELYYVAYCNVTRNWPQYYINCPYLDGEGCKKGYRAICHAALAQFRED